MPFKGNKAIIITGDLHRVRLALDEFPFKPLVEYTLGVMNASIGAYAMNVAAEACWIASRSRKPVQAGFTTTAPSTSPDPSRGT